MQNEQLEAIFKLMQNQKEKFGETSIDEIKEQMKFYCRWKYKRTKFLVIKIYNTFPVLGNLLTKPFYVVKVVKHIFSLRYLLIKHVKEIYF